MYTILLGIMAGCSEPSQNKENGPSGLQDLYDVGLAQYVGSTSPSSVTEIEDGVQYEFAVSDGPICLRGDSFRAASREGENNSLLIYLQGGGACWDEFCLAFQEANTGIPEAGILNRGLDVNPFREWNVGYVPYCDGSLFCGDREIDEDGDGTTDRYHRGLMNLTAALEAIHSDYPNPDRIVLTGMSAGGYGIVLSGALTRHLWRDAPIDIVADGGVGLGNPDDLDFISDILDQWGIVDWIDPICSDCFDDGHAVGFTKWLLNLEPTMTYKMISAKEDYIISDVFLTVGGDVYAEEIESVAADMSNAFPNQFSHFIFDGVKHTTLAIDSTSDLSYGGSMPFGDVVSSDQLDAILGRMDVVEINGVTVSDWMGDWVTNGTTPSLTE